MVLFNLCVVYFCLWSTGILASLPLTGASSLANFPIVWTLSSPVTACPLSDYYRLGSKCLNFFFFFFDWCCDWLWVQLSVNYYSILSLHWTGWKPQHNLLWGFCQLWKTNTTPGKTIKVVWSKAQTLEVLLAWLTWRAAATKLEADLYLQLHMINSLLFPRLYLQV